MNLSNLITSQDFIDDEIVAQKIATQDFAVMVSPEFVFEGQTFRMLLDGHHSLAAAIEAGVEPDVTEATSTLHDAVGLIEDGKIDDFLTVTWMGADYRFAVSGKDVW